MQKVCNTIFYILIAIITIKYAQNTQKICNFVINNIYKTSKSKHMHKICTKYATIAIISMHKICTKYAQNTHIYLNLFTFVKNNKNMQKICKFLILICIFFAYFLHIFYNICILCAYFVQYLFASVQKSRRLIPMSFK